MKLILIPMTLAIIAAATGCACDRAPAGMELIAVRFEEPQSREELPGLVGHMVKLTGTATPVSKIEAGIDVGWYWFLLENHDPWTSDEDGEQVVVRGTVVYYPSYRPADPREQVRFGGSSYYTIRVLDVEMVP